MVQAGYDTSNLVALYNNGVQCTSCCNAGIPCQNCDVVTPKTVILQITGATDRLEGVCVCTQFGGGLGTRSSKFEGISADDVLNDVLVECTQSISNPCVWSGTILLSSAILKGYIPGCIPLDCTGSSTIYNMCTIAVILTRNATTTRVRMVLLGDEDPGRDCADPAQIAWFVLMNESIDCDGSSCMCCEKEGGANGPYWDMGNATIRMWSVFCPTMHVFDVTALGNAAGCGGDEEKIQVDITIHDSDENLLDNAHVEITLTGGIEDVVYVDTDVSGKAQYLSDCLCIDDTIHIEVTNVTKGGFLWDPNDDEDSLTDSILMDCV